MRSLVRFVFVTGFAVIAGCQVVAGLETRPTDPPPLGADAGCAMTTTGPAQVRYANLVPSEDHVDVCIRPAGAATYGRPIFRNGGADCGSLAYTDVTAPLGAPATTVDIKFVPAGLTCTAPALSESLGVSLPAGAVTTIARVGGGVPEQIAVLPEQTNSDPTKLHTRFVNAAPGLKPLTFALTAENHLPTSITTPVLSAPIAFAQTAPPGATSKLGMLDDRGYINSLNTAFEVGAAEDGSTKALLHQTMPGDTGSFTLYAIGSVASNNKYPVRGLLCDELKTNGGRAVCTPTQLSTLSLTAFNVSLFGPNAPYEDARRGRLVDALKNADSDFTCLFETARKADRSTLATAAAYSYAPDLDLTTPFTDPKDQSGQTPPAPTSPPCDSTVPPADLDALFTCLEANCSTAPPGDPSGFLPGTTDCLSRKCATQFLPILNDHPACFACVIDHVESQDLYGATRNACTMDLRQPFAFGGQNPTVLLSKYPLANQDVLVLPSTNFRRTVLYAQAQLEDQTVDVFCGFLTSTLIYASVPYTGQYGAGADPGTDNAYHNEAMLQADKIIAWVKQKTDANKRPAILMGDWHASASVTMGDTNVVDPLHPETVTKFRNAFTQVNAPSWVPSCNDCPASINPYNGDVTAKWLFYDMYLVNWPANAATDQSIVFNQPVVPLPNGTTGMLSLYFGMNAKVLRPQ